MKNSKIKVLFDAGPLANGQKSGVGYYTHHLISALAKHDPEGLELVGHYFNFLGRKDPELPQYPNVHYKSSKIIPGKVLSVARRLGFQLPLEMFLRQKGDIALFPNFVSLPTLRRVKKAVVIHDLTFVDHPEYLQPANQKFLARFVQPSVEKADLVMAVSQATKDAIVRHYKIDPNKIIITPIPPPPGNQKRAPAPRFELPKKYILFVSTLEPRKNYLNLVKAYMALPTHMREEYGLVLAGGMGWHNEEPMSLIQSLQQSGEKIYTPGYVSDDEKTYLYQNATLLAMPSYYEGFGMPILEAFSYNLPVVASNIAVFKEVAGDAALYFSPSDPDDIKNCLVKILGDEALRKQQIKKDSARLKLYSWNEVAARVSKTMKELVKNA